VRGREGREKGLDCGLGKDFRHNAYPTFNTDYSYVEYLAGQGYFAEHEMQWVKCANQYNKLKHKNSLG